MLHDVTVEIYDPGQGSRREVVCVDAIGGDDAVSKGQSEAATIAVGRAWKIVGVAPTPVVEPEHAPAPVAHKAKPGPKPKAKPEPHPAPVAEVEGADFPDDTGVAEAGQ